MEQRRSSISTIDGDFFDIANPADNEYDIEVIAHALSRINRYTGHIVPEHYSVAEHCYLVSFVVPRNLALTGLLHDASEAYVGDVSSPLKKLIGKAYTDIEEAIQQEIANRFGLPYPFPIEIHEADKRVYWAERQCIAPGKDKLWHQELRASRKAIPLGWNPDQAKEKFLERFEELTNGQYRKAA